MFINRLNKIVLCTMLMFCSFSYAQDVEVGFGSIESTSMELTMNTPSDVGGFQFDVSGVELGAASGGLAADAGFTVSTGGETILGFSFSGGFIPAGSNGVLTIVDYAAVAGEICLTLGTGAISDTVGDALPVTFGEDDCDFVEECDEDADNDGICDDVDDCVGEYDECGECNGDGSSCNTDPMFGFGAWDSDTMILDIDITVGDDAVGGFQFIVTGVTIAGAAGGLAEENGFQVSVGTDSGIVLGFSMTGSTIPAGSSGVLTTLMISSVDDLNACMSDVIISDANGLDIAGDYMIGDCIVVGEVVEGCTDMAACNYDENANTDDGSCDYPEENYDCDGNCIVEEDCTGECGGDAIIDECGVCEGDNTSCLNVVYFGAVTESDAGNSMELWLNAVTDVAGFQFDVTGVTLNGISGGVENYEYCSDGQYDNQDDCQYAGETWYGGWTVSSNESGTIIGFSLEGAVLAEGQHLLTVADFNVSGYETCIDMLVLADAGGETLPSAAGDCETLTTAVGGCTDMQACNYDENANVDDGSCSYPEGTCDCEGNPTDDYCDCDGNMLDECGECGGDGIDDGECDCDGNVEDCAGECGGDAIVDECGECNGEGPSYECPDGTLVCDESECSSSATISFGTISGNNFGGDGSIEILYDATNNIAGFQFTVSGVTLTEASGGAAADSGFTVSVGSETGIVIGFAFDGSTIPAGAGALTYLHVVGIDSETQTCLSDVIVSDSEGGSFSDVMIGDCADISMLDIFDEMPTEYSLSQNYPNPFNPTTNISFSVVDAGQVSLKVYDLSGKEINELSNNFYTPGTYNVIWDATDSYGNQVSSGIYIYQLQTKDGILSNSMILMR